MAGDPLRKSDSRPTPEYDRLKAIVEAVLAEKFR
jgi:hypothetical protein